MMNMLSALIFKIINTFFFFYKLCPLSCIELKVTIINRISGLGD